MNSLNMVKAVQKQAPTFVSIKQCGSWWYAANKVAFQLGYKTLMVLFASMSHLATRQLCGL